MGVHWKDWCWSWNSNTLATWCKELTHWKRPWCWERLRAGGEGDDRGWDGWMASPTQRTWIWVDSGTWWCTGRPGVLRFMGSQKSQTRLSDWTELNWYIYSLLVELPSHCPHAILLGHSTEHLAELPVLYNNFPLAIYLNSFIIFPSWPILVSPSWVTILIYL